KDRIKYHQLLVKEIESNKKAILNKYYYDLARHCKAGQLWSKALNYYDSIIPAEPTITFNASQYLIIPPEANYCFEQMDEQAKQASFEVYGRINFMYIYGCFMMNKP